MIMPQEYCVVLFLNENTIEAIPKIWVTEDSQCYWPPRNFKQRNIRDLIKNGSSFEESWDKFKIKSLGTYATYEKAHKKALKAEETSDLSSQSDENKRKIQKNRKYIQSSSGSDTDNNYSDCSVNYPRLPIPERIPLAKKKMNSRKPCEEYCGSVCNEPNVDTTLVPTKSIPVTKKTMDSRKSYEEFCSSVHNEPNVDTTLVTTKTIPLANKDSRKSLSECSGSSSRSESGLDTTLVPTKTKTYDEQFEKLVLKKLNILFAKLSDQSETLTNIEKILETQDSFARSTATDETPFHIMTLLPIANFDDLNEIEALIDEKKNAEKLAKELSRIGGNTATELTKRIMYRIMSNALGKQFSWDGAKGKKKFKNLILAQVIINAVRMNARTKHACEDEIIKSIKMWLVRAKDRENSSKKTNVDTNEKGGHEQGST